MNEIQEIKIVDKTISNPKGAGRKPGTKNRLTILKEKKRIQMEKSIANMTDQLVNSQAIAAIGTSKVCIIVTDKLTGKKTFETVKDMKRIEKLFATGKYGEDYMIVTGSDPDWKAANAMLDRAYGKAKDTLEVQGTFSLMMLGKKAAQVDDEHDSAIDAKSEEIEGDELP